ncbi:restriction endonuclease [Candidatus Saccharibacteria bacterium]|nr:restriction endonuclease [Candidatus Saccharibacteria bacterium]
MSRKHQLRTDRALKSPTINATSKRQEKEVVSALIRLVQHLKEKHGKKIDFAHSWEWYLKDITKELKESYPGVEFHHHFDSSSMAPDGGILCLKGKPEDKFIYPIVIAEVKNQGTNDLRLKEGKKKQAKGNAIERLGKNVIGFRAALMRESIFPFVCFGYGCDFAADSSILDRVTTIAMFGSLNKTYLHNEEQGKFNRGSFYFREEKWSVDEMFEIMKDIAERSILYYFSKYKKEHFLKPE